MMMMMMMMMMIPFTFVTEGNADIHSAYEYVTVKQAQLLKNISDNFKLTSVCF
jgi:hypothetical protein